MAAPTTQVSNQPLPPPSYPAAYPAASYPPASVPPQQAPGPYYGQQGALPPPPANRWGQASAAPPPATYSNGPVMASASPGPAYRPMSSVTPPRADVTGSLPPAGAPAAGGTTVVVKSGETIASLARRYGVSSKAIMSANNIADARLVRAGQRLVIPGSGYQPAPAVQPPAERFATASVPPAVAAAGTHIVNSGDTLNAIARRYKVNRTALASANGLSAESHLSIGQRLTIPGRAAPAQQVAATAPARQMAAQPPASASPLRAEAMAPTPGRFERTASAAPAQKLEPSHKSQQPVETAAMVQPTETPEETKAEPARKGVAFRWPVRGRVIANYGTKPGGEKNDGINIAVPEGATIKAAEDGVVAYAGSELKGYGNLVLIRHSDGWVTAYAHNSEVMVKRGDSVKRGQSIARAGQSGSVTSPQLHFEVRRGSNPVDPVPLLSGG
ncbi:LysM peptidoglycan-binding domain-containing M23 family metallopeptidase [Blastochloris sulfoviridis]|nr:LysM peptidoglycan-binding domain-containing M23 family metallopeptidase [Blastochloris sulfoviridis]